MSGSFGLNFGIFRRISSCSTPHHGRLFLCTPLLSNQRLPTYLGGFLIHQKENDAECGMNPLLQKLAMDEVDARRNRSGSCSSVYVFRTAPMV
jgi:hypothetical protein